MAKKIKFTLILSNLAALTTIVGVNTSANAMTFTTFTNRSSFENAVTVDGGTAVIETFSTFTTNTSFNNTSLDVGDFTLQGVGSTGAHRVGPQGNSNFNIDSPQLTGWVSGSDSISIDIIFDRPITAFGFDYKNLSERGRVTSLLADGETVITDIPDRGDFGLGFYGFIADESISTVTFQSGNNGVDGFALDNLTYSSAASIPEFSPTFGLLALGGILSLNRWRKQRKITD